MRSDMPCVPVPIEVFAWSKAHADVRARRIALT
jgi:hypothetical protein